MASAVLPPALSLRNVVALSGRFPLLAGIDLEVSVGETLLVEGPNGAGKTSLLRVCAGLVPVSSGVVRVLGLDPTRPRTRTGLRRKVGLLAHASHLYDDLNVRENIRFAVRAAGADVGRIDGACARLGLTGRLLRTPASKLSAGQRRRVALAVLVARAPELWLLDEPHAGLDASARVLLAELIAEASAGGATVVIASHEPELMVGLAGRSVTVTGGRVTAERRLGAPDPVVAAVVAADVTAAVVAADVTAAVVAADVTADDDGDLGGAGNLAGPDDPDDLAVRIGSPVALVSVDESVTHVA